MRRVLFIALAALISISCQNSAPTAGSDPAKQKRFDLRGKVISVDKIAKTAKIEHEAIPDYMPAMTMDFPIHENWVWEDLLPGVEIRAELVEDKGAKHPYWLEKIAIVANSAPNLPPVEEKQPEQVGKSVPALSLTNQDGKKFTFADYKGKALAITFIYRECPLPTACIQMSKHFSDMANQIASDPDAKENIRLLSISFDPTRDTPEKLKQYGLGYLGKDATDNLTVWNLAVGTDKEVRAVADFFGLSYETDAADKTQINHSLVTAVIAPDGKVTRIFSGGRWTPDDVLAELKRTL